jgi:hypothetical protein
MMDRILGVAFFDWQSKDKSVVVIVALVGCFLRLELQISLEIEHLIADDSDVTDAGEYIHFFTYK